MIRTMRLRCLALTSTLLGVLPHTQSAGGAELGRTMGRKTGQALHANDCDFWDSVQPPR